jgi:SAM-dependent methyltransferase
MCHVSCVVFVGETISSRPELVRGKRVLEIGSRGHGVRPIILGAAPAEYVGVDVMPGPGVDVVSDAANLLQTFPSNRFDLVISTETLEHVPDWYRVINAMRELCAVDGSVLLTTRSEGFPYHEAPRDYWRFSTEDVSRMFEGWSIAILREDDEAPGIFLLARKSPPIAPPLAPGFAVYSIVKGGRTSLVPHAPAGMIRRLQLVCRAELSQVSKLARRFLRNR